MKPVRLKTAFAAVLVQTGLVGPSVVPCDTPASDARLSFGSVEPVWVRPGIHEIQLRDLTLPSGARSKASIRVEIAGRVVPQDKVRLVAPGKLSVAFDAGMAAPGPVDVTIRCGSEEYCRRGALYVVPPPHYRGDAGTDNKLPVVPGGTIEVEVPGLSPESLRVLLGGQPVLECARGNLLVVRMPESLQVGVETYVDVQFETELIDGKLLLERREVVVRAPPSIDEARIGFEREAGFCAYLRGKDLDAYLLVSMRLSGLRGPAEVRFRQGRRQNNELVFVAARENFAIESSEEHTCIVTIEYLGREIERVLGRWWPDETDGLRWEVQRPGATEADATAVILEEVLKTSSRGTIHLRGLPFVFIHIPVQSSYTLGLTEEQWRNGYLQANNFADCAYSEDGPVQVALAHPFLIQETEVTRAQYFKFLREVADPKPGGPGDLIDLRRAGKTTLPAETANLPATDVSFVNAARFADWLNRDLQSSSPGWTLRLPHEIEWEMAARGTDSRCFSFPELYRARALEILDRVGLTAVGCIPEDKSPFGVLDMTGNVSELTTSVYAADLLVRLRRAKVQGAFDAWDPRAPYRTKGLVERLPRAPQESCTVSVRGGAYGEPSVLRQVSVRRQQQYSVPHPQVGFRLMLVKRGEP